MLIRFHQGEHILLVGDAAYAVSPSIGQGCNLSLEDIQTSISYWSNSPLHTAHHRVFLRFTLRRKLQLLFPQWLHPFVFDLVFDSDLSYGEMLHLSQGWINKVRRSVASST
ncbi:MAG: FAD-dependent monooxygenase [Cyanobacteria bacterium P01_A01_bin.137]